MPSPVQWCAAKENVPSLEIRAVIQQQADNLLMARQRCLMKRSGMRVAAYRVVSIGVFPGFEQQTDDLFVPVLGGEGESDVSLQGAGLGQQPPGIGDAA